MRYFTAPALAALLLLTAATAFAQRAPSRVPATTTPEQEAIIRAGVELHDKGQFDEAIAKYKEVLAKSPTDVTAMFELAYTYLEKKDFDNSLATAREGAQFQSELLPMFYDLMASSYDSKGQPQQAIDAYKQGITFAPDASQLYFNMAVTYRESLNQPDEARRALEKAASLEPMHPGVHVLLGQVFQSSGYPAPAFLALSTFLVLDPGGSQALPGYGLWRAVLKGGVDPIPDRPMSATPTPDRAMRSTMTAKAAQGKKDEGDFATFESRLAPSFAAFSAKMDDGTTEIQSLIVQVSELLATLPEKPTGPAASSFVNRYYLPFFVELRQRNFVEPFVYWASQRAPVPGVTDWLKTNESSVRAFLDWASKYSWPAQ